VARFGNAEKHLAENRQEFENHNKDLANRIENKIGLCRVLINTLPQKLSSSYRSHNSGSDVLPTFAAQSFGIVKRDCVAIITHLSELEALVGEDVKAEESIDDSLDHDSLLEDRKKKIFEVRLMMSGHWSKHRRDYGVERRKVRIMAIHAIRAVIVKCGSLDLDHDGAIDLHGVGLERISDMWKCGKGNSRMILTAYRYESEVHVIFCEYFTETEHNFAVEHRHSPMSHRYNMLLDKKLSFGHYRETGFSSISSVDELA